MSYVFLQQYWWFLVSLLGALLVFLMFVQGANSLVGSLGRTPEGRRVVFNSTGRKWEITFTTLVTFGGAFFASFPLFYSTSFGGAYWVWMLILLTFVLQAVSYEFQNKLGNFLGPKTFQFFLVLNGVLGPFLIGCAVATFFEGSNFIVTKENLIDSGALTPIISRWANASHGLDVLLNPWVLVFGLAVMFLARTLGILYVMNNVADEDIRFRGSVRIIGTAVPFLVLFVAWLVHLLMKDGFAVGEGGLLRAIFPGRLDFIFQHPLHHGFTFNYFAVDIHQLYSTGNIRCTGITVINKVRITVGNKHSTGCRISIRYHVLL